MFSRFFTPHMNNIIRANYCTKNNASHSIPILPIYGLVSGGGGAIVGAFSTDHMGIKNAPIIIKAAGIMTQAVVGAVAGLAWPIWIVPYLFMEIKK